MAEQEPENAHLRWPLTFLVFLIILSIEVCVVLLWKIINNLFGTNDRITRLRYVNVSIAAISFIWLVIAVIWTIVVIRADDPGLPVVVTVIECGVTLIGLIYLVYRKLLKQHLTIK